MRSDPHDAMLLSSRPTTVITQGTALTSPMPDPYGSSAEEESLFSGVGEDPTPAVVQTADTLAVAPRTVPPIKIPWGLIAFVAVGYFALAKAR